MATTFQPYTFRHGFKQPAEKKPWVIDRENPNEEQPHYTVPPSVELLTSTKHNDRGINVLRTWPTLYDGTASPHGNPDWWQPKEEVDVLICGAGPSGLETAISLIRQGLTFRIIDKSPQPLIAGRADGVQPRFLETLHMWGLSSEVQEEGPLIERTALFKDGKLLHYGGSHQSDSRYRGLHIITQGQIERIYIRDLWRHKHLIERNTVLKSHVVSEGSASHPVQCTLQNTQTGKEEVVKAKFLVGSDGGSSSIRRSLEIPFDGVDTGIYWGILDCRFDSDYPYAWNFGSVVSTEHGGCVIIPREHGYIRLYTKLDVSATGNLAQSRQAKDPDFQEVGGAVNIHSITPEEVLEQARKVFHPYKLEMATPLSWFAVWKISERIARNFSSENLRVHLAGDAAHIHSVMGAFGLNVSIIDTANLAWKIGMCVKGQAKLETLMPTYDYERRLHANRVIEVSGTYLRFVCGSDLGVVDLRDKGKPLGGETVEKMKEGESRTLLTPDANNAHPDEAVARGFLLDFFNQHGGFLLGIDVAYGHSVINPPSKPLEGSQSLALTVKNGVRAPNPRVCFSAGQTGYLYDKMAGPAKFHIVVFGSDLKGPVRKRLAAFSASLSDPNSFFNRFGGKDLFNLILVAKGVPFEIEQAIQGDDLKVLKDSAIVLSDDRAPDEDAHTTYGANHATGAAVFVRPDLWVGLGVAPDELEVIDRYFEQFLIPVTEQDGLPQGHVTTTPVEASVPVETQEAKAKEKVDTYEVSVDGINGTSNARREVNGVA